MRRGNYAFAGPLALAATGLSGCQLDVLHPQGPVGVREDSLIVITFAAMMIVVIPVFFMTFFFAWRYRATGNATYQPKWTRSLPVELGVWGVPLAIILFLGVLSWRSTHALDPYRPLNTRGTSLNVQVVALDWKWLFIYPDQHIATIGQLEIPIGTQVNFLITSDTVMNVFFIPQLGSQIYAMAGMQTQLHLLAKNPGTYQGISANFSGAGFPDMRFATVAVSPTSFNAWVRKVQTTPSELNDRTYTALAGQQTAPTHASYYGQVEPGLFEHIVTGHSGPMQMATGKMP